MAVARFLEGVARCAPQELLQHMQLRLRVVLQPVPMRDAHRAPAGARILGHVAAQLDALVEDPLGNAERVLDLLNLPVEHLFWAEAMPGMTAVFLNRGPADLAQRVMGRR